MNIVHELSSILADSGVVGCSNKTHIFLKLSSIFVRGKYRINSISSRRQLSWYESVRVDCILNKDNKTTQYQTEGTFSASGLSV